MWWVFFPPNPSSQGLTQFFLNDDTHFDISSASPGDSADIFLLEDHMYASGEQVFLLCIGSMCVYEGKHMTDSEEEDPECLIMLKACFT